MSLSLGSWLLLTVLAPTAVRISPPQGAIELRHGGFVSALTFTRDGKTLNVAQHHTRLADQSATVFVEADEAVEAGRAPQHAVGVEADIAVASSQAVGDAGPAARQLGGDAAAVGELDHLVRKGREPTP